MTKVFSGARRGFTLIELLVVIAIIGILSAVVLASLNTARSKGNDASIKSNLDTIRTQSAIYYDTNNGYGSGGTGNIAAPTATACNNTSSLFADANVTAALVSAEKAGGGSGTTLATLTKPLCQLASGTAAAPSATISAAALATQWSVYEPTINNTGGNTGWCVDGNGTSKADTIPVSGTVACP